MFSSNLKKEILFINSIPHTYTQISQSKEVDSDNISWMMELHNMELLNPHFKCLQSKNSHFAYSVEIVSDSMTFWKKSSVKDTEATCDTRKNP